jgi:hypothetical protein
MSREDERLCLRIPNFPSLRGDSIDASKDSFPGFRVPLFPLIVVGLSIDHTAKGTKVADIRFHSEK